MHVESFFFFFSGFKSVLYICFKLRCICWVLKLRNVGINSVMYLDMVMDSWKICFIYFKLFPPSPDWSLSEMLALWNVILISLYMCQVNKQFREKQKMWSLFQHRLIHQPKLCIFTLIRQQQTSPLSLCASGWLLKNKWLGSFLPDVTQVSHLAIDRALCERVLSDLSFRAYCVPFSEIPVGKKTFVKEIN